MLPSIIKFPDANNKITLFEFIKAWEEDENIKHGDWMKSRLVPLPKKGVLHDLNKWRGMNLLCVVSKVFRIILNERAQKLLKKNEQPMYFGATPKVGCWSHFYHSRH